MRKNIAAFLAVVAWSAAPLMPTQAQDLGGALDLPMLGQSLTLSASIRAQAERDAARLRGKSAQGRPAQTRRIASKSNTRFRTSKAVRQRNLARFVANIRRADPQNAALLQQSFAKGDPIAMIAPQLRRYGLDTNDVADATAAYLTSAWYGVRGRNDDPPRAYVIGVRNQMRDIMLSNRQFISASDATKQEMADAMILLLMVNDSLLTSAKGNPALMGKVKSAIGQGARNTLRLDLSTLKLTSQGLRM